MPRPGFLPLVEASRPMPRQMPLVAGAEAPPERPEALEQEAAGTAEAEQAAAEAETETETETADADTAEAEQAAAEAAEAEWLGREGPICGNPAIRGERVQRVEGAGECGIVRPVRVDAVAGVALAPAPTLACPAAEALAAWLERSAKPAFAEDGAPLVELGIAAGYVCRNINYAEQGDVSEHALGLAIDIARFGREDGETVTVLEGWGSEAHGALLRSIHEDACGIFGTALGPDSDQYHQDHFHFDAAERRRPYCPDDLAGGEGEEDEAEDEPEEETEPGEEAAAEQEEAETEPGGGEAADQEDREGASEPAEEESAEE